ncbi:hypothetical protein KCTC32516_01143 [Polaribacter huanghezhanensis]|uniref:hypothetical protein n=1 Tax=Polaribacter huanghezhanensis TaxID=1354726 RepID=UPI0026492DF7|nr:hypothetical protein [Polaribacter huanghezhanensis]WKD85797.1 hypothetical protein KCTC32516_01143 [Polaribacter huanghezhanensis]
MTILEKLKSPGFWINFLKIALPFLLFVTLISLFMTSWRAIFAGDFAEVNEVNFTEGKWQRFWGFKIGISFLYALYMTIRKTK